ncbi:cytochrome c oxidase assembly factor 7 [Lingula anatina]|uniref:Cytochrome c oxidase assembly factor 7 n=1 Tax=Lingula anatina TaxID=7574 RepID=A0A1S3JA81_LINAN|nr:cytochrome c oxidase assembly factor 7 [Lingula anatina]|eukprot:XP_013406789.1 cytochrome c oxidase assembly factor 7 [Lingula anatina]
MKNFKAAKEVFSENCENFKEGLSCQNAAEIASLNEHNEENALKYFSLGCQYGFLPSCHNEGLMNLRSENKNEKKALSCLHKACNGNFPESCHLIGTLYLNPKIVPGATNLPPRDVSQGVIFLTKACDQGGARACKTLINMYEKGDIVGKSASMVELFKAKLKQNLEKKLKMRPDGISAPS